MEEVPFVQRIKYSSTFIDDVLLKAQVFYFKKFLPVVAPYVIVSPSLENQGYTGCSDVPRHLFSPTPVVLRDMTLYRLTASKKLW